MPLIASSRMSLTFIILSVLTTMSCGKRDGNVDLRLVKSGIIGVDDRVKVKNTAVYPYSSVGKVIGFGPGSGSLIAPNVVITAAHVAQHFAAIFEPGVQDKVKKLGSFKVAEIIYPQAFEQAKCDETENEKTKWVCDNYDFAFLILEESVKNVKPFRLKVLEKQDEMTLKLNVIGYGSPTSHLQKEQKKPCYGYMMYWKKDTRLLFPYISSLDKLEDYLPLIHNNCDNMPGDSGAPLLTYDKVNEEHFLIGVQVRAMAYKNTPEWSTFGEPFKADDWYQKTSEGSSTAVPAKLILKEIESQPRLRKLIFPELQP